MARYHMVNGVNEPFTSDEETFKDTEEAAWLLKNPVRSEAYLEAEAQIEKLESSITSRRYREAIAGTDDGWLANQENLIAVERGKL